MAGHGLLRSVNWMTCVQRFGPALTALVKPHGIYTICDQQPGRAVLQLQALHEGSWPGSALIQPLPILPSSKKSLHFKNRRVTQQQLHHSSRCHSEPQHAFAPKPSFPTGPSHPGSLLPPAASTAPSSQCSGQPRSCQRVPSLYCFLPADERVLAGQMFLRPFLRRSFNTLRPVLLAMRVRKPEVRRRALQQHSSRAAAVQFDEMYNKPMSRRHRACRLDSSSAAVSEHMHAW